MIAVLGEISRWALLAVFALSLAHKLSAPRAVARGAAELLAVGARLGVVLAVLAALAEAGLVVALLGLGATALPYGLAAGLLVVYSAALAAALRRGADTSCACFSSSSPVRGADLGRNAVLLTMAALGAVGAGSAAAAPADAGRLLAVLGGLAVGAALTQVSRALDYIDQMEAT